MNISLSKKRHIGIGTPITERPSHTTGRTGHKLKMSVFDLEQIKLKIFAIYERNKETKQDVKIQN